MNCPACHSADIGTTLPDSPELLTWRCHDCGHRWSSEEPMPHWGAPQPAPIAARSPFLRAISRLRRRSLRVLRRGSRS